jgi:hypothetical protein
VSFKLTFRPEGWTPNTCLCNWVSADGPTRHCDSGQEGNHFRMVGYSELCGGWRKSRLHGQSLVGAKAWLRRPTQISSDEEGTRNLGF